MVRPVFVSCFYFLMPYGASLAKYLDARLEYVTTVESPAAVSESLMATVECLVNGEYPLLQECSCLELGVKGQ